jgi:hypothetical protein
MKRFLMQLDGSKSKLIHLNDNGSANARLITDVSDDTGVDLTNCPNDEVLLQAGREFCKRVRYPQKQWFNRYPWLLMSVSRKVVLCDWCCKATKINVVGMSKSDSSFTNTGFNNWKDGASKLEEHALSSAHAAAVDFMAQKNKPSVAAQVSTQLAHDQEQNRRRLIAELQCIMFLMRQGLALRRGKDERNDNLHQLLQLLASNGVVEAEACLTHCKHLSHEIVNELCGFIGQTILRMVLEDFKKSCAIPKYALLADETRDVSGIEQITVCIRWVDKTMCVHEDLLGMYSLRGIGQTAEVLTKCLKDVLIRCQLPFADLHGQGYDGASAMAGSVSGVAQRLKESAPTAHFVHCLAHCLSLAVSDAAKRVPLLKHALDIVHQLVTFIRNSGKRQDIFADVQLQSAQSNEEHQGQPIKNAVSLHPLCPTRWTVRASAINSDVCNYEHLMQTLDDIQADRTTPSDASSTAGGLLKQMERAETYFQCYVSYRLFAITDAFATSIQRPTMNLSEVLRRKRQVLDELHLFRQQFEVIFDNAVLEATRLELIEMQLPRKRRVPARIDIGKLQYPLVT